MPGIIRPEGATNIKTFLSTMLGNREPITEKNFSAKELKTLRDAARRAERQKRNGISYYDYSNNGDFEIDAPGWVRALKESFVNPDYSVATTIGLANTKRDKHGNLIVEDTYDFNRDGPGHLLKQEMERGNIKGALKFAADRPTELLDMLGYLLAPEGKGRKVRVNLGK